MRVAVAFDRQLAEFDVPDEKLVGAWSGPEALAPDRAARRLAEALDRPLDYPPLRETVVPGDRVVIVADPDLPDAERVLEAIRDRLKAAEVESIRLLCSRPPDFRSGLETIIHRPDDRAELAYLATTSGGRRVYLNREVTDADWVVTVGTLGFDPIVGYRGPWSVLYPGMSDRESRDALAKQAGEPGAGADGDRQGPLLRELAEVSWLLGSQFQLGVVAAGSGVADVVGGLGSSVLEAGVRAVDAAWEFRPATRADLVIAGVGPAGGRDGLELLGVALETARALARQGGKIALLSQLEGEVGPAFGRLIGAGDPRAGLAALRGRQADPDHLPATQVARAASWADVYLLSRLDPGLVEDLSMIPLGGAEEVRRLVATATDCLILNAAESTRATPISDD